MQENRFRQTPPTAPQYTPPVQTPPQYTPPVQTTPKYTPPQNTPWQYPPQYLPQKKLPSGRGKSIAGFVLGVLSLSMMSGGLLPSVLGIIFSAIGMKQCKTPSRDLAVAGLILSIIALSITLFSAALSAAIFYLGNAGLGIDGYTEFF